MASKHYAVRIGRKVGIFDNWAECEAQVKGYPGAIYKSFSSIQDATEFIGKSGGYDISPKKQELINVEKKNINNENINLDWNGEIHETKYEDKVIMQTSNRPDVYSKMGDRELMAYVDGSFNSSNNEYPVGWGYILIDNQGNEFLMEGRIHKGEEGVSTRNVLGEIFAATKAAQKALQTQATKLTIRHDYVGVGKWPNKEWKANTDVTINYSNFMNEVRNRGLEIVFEKVDAHTGDYYNEVADKLAGM